MRTTALIDHVLADAITGTKVAGLVAAAADADGTIYEEAFGRRSLAQTARMTSDTVFRIASMTKAITGAAAMQMVEQGKLALDQWWVISGASRSLGDRVAGRCGCRGCRGGQSSYHRRNRRRRHGCTVAGSRQ